MLLPWNIYYFYVRWSVKDQDFFSAFNDFLTNSNIQTCSEEQEYNCPFSNNFDYLVYCIYNLVFKDEEMSQHSSMSL